MVAVVKNEILNDSNMEKENEKIINENESNFNNLNVENKENLQNNKDEKVEKEDTKNTELNSLQKSEDKMEIDNNKTEIENMEQDDKASIGLTSDEEDENTKIMEGNKTEDNEKNTIKMEDNNETSDTNVIDNKTAPINNIENNRIENTEVDNEVSNQTDISKDSNELSTNSQSNSSPITKNIQKRHMPRSESSVCSLIIKTMERQPNALPFLKPVDPVALNIPDYFNVIKHPMDFSTILKKLKKGEYPSMVEFVDDVDLVFKNCMTYNPPNNPVHIMGKEMKNFFIEQLKKYPDHFSEILLNKFNIDLSTIEKRPRRQVRPPQHFEPEDELLMKRIKQQQKRSLMEQNEMKAYIPKIEEPKMAMETYEEETVIDDIKPTKSNKTITKPQKIRKTKKAAKVASKTTIKKRARKRSYREIDEVEEEEEIDEDMEDSSESSTDSEDELMESQITALTACLQQVQQQLELLQAQQSLSRHARKKSRRSLSSFSEYYSNTEKENPISSKALAAAHRKISSTSNTLPTPAPTRGRKKQNNIRKTAITNAALQNTGTRKRSKTKSETGSPAKRSPANHPGKVCEYCGGSETPMWRRGPSGKGSLCNKCGVKWKSGKIYKGEPIPSQSGLNSANNSVASSAVSTPNINPPPKTKRQKAEAPPKKQRVQSITYAQKKELSEMIGKLDEDNLNGVLDIIRSGIPDLKDGQEEIELDIETIDPVTLRKLYRYVKKVSKPEKVVQVPVNQELQNYSDYSSGNDSSDSGDDSND
eukprot:jgi/Orpsp1_1/1175672/evm.model.c7180000054772.1